MQFPQRLYPRLQVHGATPRLARAVLHQAKAVCLLERAPPAVQLHINFISFDHMRRLNPKQQPTDVLTFSPQMDVDRKINDLLFGGEEGPGGNLESDISAPLALPNMRQEVLDLGEIYVCLEYIMAHCTLHPSKNLPLVSYIQAALVHAQLHALGYNHDTSDDLAIMAAREQYMGWQLRQLRRRYPTLLPPPDAIEYLMAQRRAKSPLRKW